MMLIIHSQLIPRLRTCGAVPPDEKTKPRSKQRCEFTERVIELQNVKSLIQGYQLNRLLLCSISRAFMRINTGGDSINRQDNKGATLHTN
jgi:hypothetical protein